ncbi:hypothetical protein BHE74_00010579 [Ensete ventricosum]|nr:hypothetical protein BHE74_00010579 [Ensete ventricosum]
MLASASMVAVDRHMAALTPAHAAGLRRLSSRAAAAPSSSRRRGLHSLRPLAEDVLSHLRASSVPLGPGLSEPELVRLEAELSLSFPPDLRALLALALPSAPGFPDWRAPRPGRLLRLPLAAAALQVARGALWPRSWGPRPAESVRALRCARAALRRAPLLLPLFRRCYVPCYPCLAGNPVFYVDDTRVFSCALDLADFFQRHFAALQPPPSFPRSLHATAGFSPRRIQFWSEAAYDSHSRNSYSSSSSFCTSSSSAPETPSSSSSSPPLDQERFVEIPTPRLSWFTSYLDRLGSVLRQGGWGESDIREMVYMSSTGVFNGCEDAAVDAEAVLDALLVKADVCSDSLLRAGWSSDEFSDVLGLDLGPRRGTERHPPTKADRLNLD